MVVVLVVVHGTWHNATTTPTPTPTHLRQCKIRGEANCKDIRAESHANSGGEGVGLQREHGAREEEEGDGDCNHVRRLAVAIPVPCQVLSHHGPHAAVRREAEAQPQQRTLQGGLQAHGDEREAQNHAHEDASKDSEEEREVLEDKGEGQEVEGDETDDDEHDSERGLGCRQAKVGKLLHLDRDLAHRLWRV